WSTAPAAPERGEMRSETAFTDSTSPYEEPFVTSAPSSGCSKCTRSPSESCANHAPPRARRGAAAPPVGGAAARDPPPARPRHPLGAVVARVVHPFPPPLSAPHV